MTFKVETLDLGFGDSEKVSAHLLSLFDAASDSWRYALVDVGSAKTVPRLMEQLADRRVDLNALEWVFLTHVHLDHAGGAGTLLSAHLPKARAVVHEQGSVHLADPSRLVAGARAVYGDAEFERHYGEVLSVPLERQWVVGEGHRMDFGNALILDTPGHARHHYCLWFEFQGVVFTGDTFGLSYPSLTLDRGPFLYPTTTPTAFEPERLVASVRRIAALGARSAYLTHFGEVREPARWAEDLVRRIQGLAALAASGAPDLRRAQEEYAARELRNHGILDVDQAIATLSFDFGLNALGLEHWRSRGQGAQQWNGAPT